jgi:competence protein ComEA
MNLPEISRRRALAYSAALLVLLALAGRLLIGGGKGAPSGESRERPPASLVAEATPKRKLVVHVVGAVRRPGLYRLEDGSRVDDAIDRAGGARSKAALELVNLAAPVADGQQVLVPARARPASAAGQGTAAAGAPTAAAGAPGGRVHLNSATLEQLDALPGVGPVTAQKILDYRTQKGAFSSVDELDAVPGIGPARLEQLRELVDL